jgi:hypothetical protein
MRNSGKQSHARILIPPTATELVRRNGNAIYQVRPADTLEIALSCAGYPIGDDRKTAPSEAILPKHSRLKALKLGLRGTPTAFR